MRVCTARIAASTEILGRTSPAVPVATTGAVFLRPGGAITLAGDLRALSTGPRLPPVRRLKAVDAAQIPTSSRIVLRAGVALIR